MSNALQSALTFVTSSPVVASRLAAPVEMVAPGPVPAPRPGPGSPLATDGRNFGVGHKR